jgi:dATP/dGTP diphosphohydrolase
MFEVKDSGKREEYTSGMRRDTNEGKVRYDLIVPETMKTPMLKRWAEHMTKGALKYGDRNWEKAVGEAELKRFRESAFRHFMQWYQGEVDEDHASAVFFNIQGAEYVQEKMGPQVNGCRHLPHPEFDYLCALCEQVVKAEK